MSKAKQRYKSSTIESDDFERRFYEVKARLDTLTDHHPHAAVEAARALIPDEILNQDSIDWLVASTLIDAGSVGDDPHAVNEGVTLIERLLEASPERSDLQYCLANGLSSQADSIPYSGPQWFIETRDLRRRARNAYWVACKRQETPPHIATRSYTNLGNSLLRAYRFVEAYDAYMKALELDVTNGVALTGAARVLLQLVDHRIGNPGILHGLAARYLQRARANPDRIRELTGEYGYREIAKLMESEIPSGMLPDLSGASAYQRFVAKHRLSLAPTIEGLDLTMSCWDSLRITCITEQIGVCSEPPPLFAMFNVLKSEFLAARYLTFLAMEDVLPESGKYTDTLDYACYGIQSAMLTLAQRACLDLLDKVAVAVTDYLDLPGYPKSIYFITRWFNPQAQREPASWLSQIENEIIRGNTALIAISEVAGDLEAKGFLQEKRLLRNASTHRFTVLHDLGTSPSRESKLIEHHHLEAFVSQLIETIRLTRAVLMYFVEMVMIREHRSHSDNFHFMPLFLPDHDWVRGKAE